tara:strand:+ start:1305 stop:1703 length:399 start_codon:yes stop_codon:yes gene_type:complete
MVVLDLGLLNNFITNITVEDKISMFSYRGTDSTATDRLLARGVAYIEKLLNAAADFTTAETIDHIVKKGYRSEYIEATFLAAVKTAFYANVKYNDGVGTWDATDGTELAIDVGSYALFAGILKGIGAIEIVT